MCGIFFFFLFCCWHWACLLAEQYFDVNQVKVIYSRENTAVYPRFNQNTVVFGVCNTRINKCGGHQSNSCYWEVKSFQFAVRALVCGHCASAKQVSIPLLSDKECLFAWTGGKFLLENNPKHQNPDASTSSCVRLIHILIWNIAIGSKYGPPLECAVHVNMLTVPFLNSLTHHRLIFSPCFQTPAYNFKCFCSQRP